jgi:hypothetical protein
VIGIGYSGLGQRGLWAFVNTVMDVKCSNIKMHGKEYIKKETCLLWPLKLSDINEIFSSSNVLVTLSSDEFNQNRFIFFYYWTRTNTSMFLQDEGKVFWHVIKSTEFTSKFSVRNESNAVKLLCFLKEGKKFNIWIICTTRKLVE